MADFIPAFQTLRVTQDFTSLQGTTATCRFFLFYSTATPTNSELNTMAAAAVASLNTHVMPLLTAEWTSGACTIVDLTTDTSAIGTASTPEVGTRSGPVMPIDSAMVCSFEIDRRYRGGHPRIYLPAGSQTDISTAFTWGTTIVGLVETAVTDWINATIAGAWAGSGAVYQVNASFYSGGTWEPYGTPTKYRRVPTSRGTANLNPVTSIITRSYIASQRRRRGTTV